MIPAAVSAATKWKIATKSAPEGLPVHSLTTLLADLEALTLNRVPLPGCPDSQFSLVAEPTALQMRAFDLLAMHPARDVPIRMAG
ncbi:MAG: hypothetical protein OXC91_06110 [Rhodobacteraceae bacterium]|nr:hypothetical protein [Paracoccaceae bacterium]